VNTQREPLADAIARILGGPADAVFEVTGNPAVVEQAWRITSPKGRLILVGVMRHDQQLSFNPLPLHYGKVLTGSEGGSSRPAIDIPRYLRMIREARFDPRGMVTHRCPLPKINDSIATMRAGQSIHTMIHF
jgi:S-(hydroxymethyl)glutathione dehydrogenase/alcohol dehydrogenase